MAIHVSGMARSQALFFLLCLAPQASAGDEGVNCKPNVTGFDVCAEARFIQLSLAKSLPKQINANILLEQATVAGPRITMRAVWSLSDADLASSLSASGSTKAELATKMQALANDFVCKQAVLAAFVRLGGEMEYLYETTDAVVVATPVIKDCPETK